MNALPVAKKDNHAIVLCEDGSMERTVWGYYLPEDIEVLAREYPEVPRDVIEKIAVEANDKGVETIPAPRLLEVMTVLEPIARFLRGEFTKIKRGVDKGLKLVANPLSILAFTGGRVQRVIATETELMHKPAEKLALRSGALERINAILSEHFGLQVAFGCSCCVIVARANDMPKVLASEYYGFREQQGRWWDSDILAATGNLFGPIPVAEVPQAFLDGSVDFGEAEVMSYQRFARVAHMCLSEHPNGNKVNLNKWHNRAACRIGGQCQKAGDHCPLPPV